MHFLCLSPGNNKKMKGEVAVFDICGLDSTKEIFIYHLTRPGFLNQKRLA